MPTTSSSLVVALLLLVLFVWHRRRRAYIQKSVGVWRPPVVLIPGLGGSRLYGANGTLKWCTWHGFFPHVTNAWRDELTVKYNPDTLCFEEASWISPYRTPHWVHGRFQPTADFGGVEGVGNVLSPFTKSSWQFQGLINTCVARGYNTWNPHFTKSQRQHPCLYGAPFDFRKITSPVVWTEYCKSLRALIEFAADNGNEGSILLSHSMGSALLLTFLVLYLPQAVDDPDAWKERYVKRWISVNGAFGGAGKALRSLLSGDNNGMGYLCDTGCHDWYQPLQENAAGVLWMLPSPLVFTANTPVITVGQKQYSAKQVLTLLTSVAPAAARAYQDTVSPLLTVQAPRVPIVCVTSTQPGTPLQCCYSSSALHHTNVKMRDERAYYADTASSVTHMCGDGTVPYLSLMVPQLWLDQQTQPVTFVRLNQENLGHTSILLEDEPLRILLSLIS